MKTIGIAADDYKLERFKTDLTAAGFTNFKVVNLTPNTYLISVEVEDSKVYQIKKICEKVQKDYKNKYTKEN